MREIRRKQTLTTDLAPELAKAPAQNSLENWEKKSSDENSSQVLSFIGCMILVKLLSRAGCQFPEGS